MAKHQSKLAPWLVIVLAVAAGLIFWRPKAQPVPIKEITEASPSPSPEPVLSATSGDGKIALEMTKTKRAAATTWTLTATKDGKVPETIWWQTLPEDVSMSIPFNTVSPDNKYLFLKQTESDKTAYLVLKVNGEPMKPGSQAVEFGNLFASKYPEYKISEVTGWGGINLIVFNTDKTEGGTGPSFWYEVPSGAFIRLANRFE